MTSPGHRRLPGAALAASLRGRSMTIRDTWAYATGLSVTAMRYLCLTGRHPVGSAHVSVDQALSRPSMMSIPANRTALREQENRPAPPS
jgi:hypothetical protein